MHYAIVADIHANIDAFRAVLDALSRTDVDQIICAGDVVGYGACPQECIDILRERKIPTVMGNHDEYTTQVGADWMIRPQAREVIHWNQEHLSEDSIEWLAALPRRLDGDGFCVVHSACTRVPDWAYVLSERAAVQHFLFQPSPLCFNGHSHVPIHVSHSEGKKPLLRLLNTMVLPRQHRTLIGVGSVGQPRDGDPRATCVLYDS